MLIKRLSNAIAKYRFCKEILDFAKPNPIKQQLTQHPLNYMVVHPIGSQNKGPELEFYMAEEAIGFSKQLNWTLVKGSFEWNNQTKIKDMNTSQEKIHQDQQDNQSQKQREQQEFQEDDLGQEWGNYITGNSIVKSSLVKLPSIHSTTFFTKAKLSMLGQHIQSKGVNAVFINHELTSLQTRNLKKVWTQYSRGEIASAFTEDVIDNDENNKNAEEQAKSDSEGLSVQVYDRFTMLLLLFAKRSTQGISKLQVELTFLKFAKAKLETGDSSLQTLASIFKEQLMVAKEIDFEILSAKQKKNQGKNNEYRENELLLQRRIIDDKIEKVKQLIEEDNQSRLKIKRKIHAHTIPKIALIGFTNAGKAQLLNCILQKDETESKDQISQILSTNQKSVRLASGQKAIILNTIGFITDLPQDFIEVFKSTLGEVEDADIVLHIRDISHPHSEKQKQVVYGVLKDLGFNQDFFNQKMIEVWNKIDLMKHSLDYDQIESYDYPIVPTSALMNINIQKLLQVMEEKSNYIMNKKLYRLKYNIDQHFERLRWLYDVGNISGVKNEVQKLPIKRGDPTIIEYDVIIDEVTYNRYIATFQPEIRIKKDQGISPKGWK
ncbi:unnamed protein product (macronuclear) [Paramecium tetraurelia]|uniref:Hflx-type G domain-containing protein n=1 Tax=Paramecium tetraurelia TaxID=5888 RepID=A0BWU6_PARTE|nr:uncharacterized protein GSPATT00032865001 [Paramecium tetraurelia]CAK63013.1 unnamed protein product [Paramecium tetraurelia]|eukprot:XP_001430411.1 hypothetical protein (macronuclear) [Paramecium tetraurelia strain d4-2]